MPDDRLFHKRLGHSAKVNQLSDLEEIVWHTYIQAADDFGVMRFAAVSLQAAHERLEKRPRAVVQRMLERVREVGLVVSFEHQGHEYCCQLDWQDYQKVRYPLRTANPRIPDTVLQRATRATRWLLTAWPGGKKKLATWQPPDSFEPSGSDSGNSSGNLPGILPGNIPETSRRSRADAGAGGVFPVPDPVAPIPVPDPSIELGGDERLVPLDRSVAAPPSSDDGRVLFPSPNSTEPATDGNFAVIERIAHEVLDDLRLSEPTFEAAERVKELCAQRHIDYGRHEAVPTGVVRRAVESAAAQRLLLPVRTARGSAPTSLRTLADDFRARLEAARPQAREA